MSKVRVRFAPSPTGYLHIGGARTALYNYLYAKKVSGENILRIEDTDLERSTKSYEEALIADLDWLGLTFDEGPKNPKAVGPYRQSERLDLYERKAVELIQAGKAFYCFCSDEVLEKKKEEAAGRGEDPRYDGTCRRQTLDEALKRKTSGEKCAVRFHAPQKDYTFVDHVRGEVTFPTGMVGDFILMRSNGLPVYNYCCVVDDIDMKISHVIRAEDHLANTLRQLMLYEAYNVTPPQFAHVSLLIGHDRQKLSKRHAATSVAQYRESGHLPEAVLNYLCQLGWSHPNEQDIFTPEEIIPLFSLDRFTKSAAMFDMEKLAWVNGEYLKRISIERLIVEAEKFIPENHLYYTFSNEKRAMALNLFKEKVQLLPGFLPFLSELFEETLVIGDDFREILSWETTPQIVSYFKEELMSLSQNSEFATDGDFNRWSETLKGEKKIKGKNLFMGMRGVLTGKNHGSDLKTIVQLTPLKVLTKRVSVL